MLICYLQELAQNFIFFKVSWLLRCYPILILTMSRNVSFFSFFSTYFCFFSPEAEYHGHKHLITPVNGHSILRLSSTPIECLMVSSIWMSAIESIASWSENNRLFLFLHSFKPFTSYPTPLTLLVWNFQRELTDPLTHQNYCIWKMLLVSSTCCIMILWELEYYKYKKHYLIAFHFHFH